MTGVLGRPYLARQDAALGVGVSQSFGIRWLQADSADSPRVPVDMSDYTGYARLASLNGDPWLEVQAVLHSDGLCEIIFTPEMTSGPEWSARSAGQWAVSVRSPGGVVTVLVYGYLNLSTPGSF